MMRPSSPLLLLLATILSSSSIVSASIFLPGTTSTPFSKAHPKSSDATFHRRRSLHRALQKQNDTHGNSNLLVSPLLAMAIPGNTIAEQVVLGGFGTFLGIYNTVITARILLSWFPQAAGQPLLQPVFQITDPYLNLFRGLIPPVFGLDLSTILAFVTLNLLQSSTATLAAEIPMDVRERFERKGGEMKGRFGMAIRRGRGQQVLL